MPHPRGRVLLFSSSSFAVNTTRFRFSFSTHFFQPLLRLEVIYRRSLCELEVLWLLRNLGAVQCWNVATSDSDAGPALYKVSTNILSTTQMHQMSYGDDLVARWCSNSPQTCTYSITSKKHDVSVSRILSWLKWTGVVEKSSTAGERKKNALHCSPYLASLLWYCLFSG